MDPENKSEEQEVEQKVDDGMVDVHEASIDDLDAALKNATLEESGTEIPSDSSSTQNQEPQPEAGEEKVSSAKRDVAATGATSSQNGNNSSRNLDQDVTANNERQTNQGNQKELFIQHRTNELGALRREYAATRQQLSQVKAQLEGGLQDKFSENPVEAMKDKDRIKEIEEQLEGLNSHEERASKVVEAQTFFLRHVDTEKVSIDDLGEVLLSDGIDAQYVNQFKANPWDFTTPEALVQMGRRAMDRKELRQADNDRRVLAKHVLYLMEQIKTLRGRPGQVVQQLQKSLRQSPNVTAASPATSRGGYNIDPTRMSISELDAAIQKASLNG